MTFCEAHTQYYVTRSQYESNQRYPMCCTEFFDPVPMFTMSGTCYTSKAEVVENFPSVYSAIRVWLMTSQQNVPGKSIVK